MPKKATLAIALLPLMACSPVTSATGSDPVPATAAAHPEPFAAPQVLSRDAAVATSKEIPDAAITDGVATPVTPGMVVFDTANRGSDLSQAVAATFPVAVQRLGSPARMHVHVESIDAPLAGQAVVVFLGVEFAGAGLPPVRRVAVPVHWHGRHWVAGTPWDLPPPATPRHDGADEGATLPADDPALLALAIEALAAAGWHDIVIESLHVPIEGWAHPVRFEAAHVGGEGRVRHVVWLRRDLDRLVVAGTSTTTVTTTPEGQEPA